MPKMKTIGRRDMKVEPWVKKNFKTEEGMAIARFLAKEGGVEVVNFVAEAILKSETKRIAMELGLEYIKEHGTDCLKGKLMEKHLVI